MLICILICIKFYKFFLSFSGTGFHKRMCVTIAVLVGGYLGDQSIWELDNLGRTGKKREC